MAEASSGWCHCHLGARDIHTGFHNPYFLLFTLLADFLYLSLNGVLLYLMCPQVLIDALDEECNIACCQSVDLGDQNWEMGVRECCLGC